MHARRREMAAAAESDSSVKKKKRSVVVFLKVGRNSAQCDLCNKKGVAQE